MACSNPYIHPHLGIECPCRKCALCKKARSKHWSLRCENEMVYHKDSTLFVTFTYDDDNLVPKGTFSDVSKSKLKKAKIQEIGDSLDYKHVGTLLKSDMQKYWKRLRIILARRGFTFKFKYYMCGEYGSNRGRPHYHAIIFGIPFGFETLIRDTWDKGIVDIRVATPSRIKYTAGYVNKKLVGAREDLYYLKNGYLAAYQSMSQGIGLQYAIDNSKQILENLSLRDSAGHVHSVPKYYKDKLDIDKSLFEKKASESMFNELSECLEMIDKYSYSEKDIKIINSLDNGAYSFKFRDGSGYYPFDMLLSDYFGGYNLPDDYDKVDFIELRKKVRSNIDINRDAFISLSKAYLVRRDNLKNLNEIQKKKVEAKSQTELF